ncbi:hypothetical protein O3P69_005862 [Scylla paramamosain]|uniref:UDP-glucuronosyltransferase n=1 Tax=Scylla paramamosain TaxID=85552 RepID=A0AAW0U567_SCYPA
MRLCEKVLPFAAVVAVLVVQETSAARILMMVPIGTRSHLNFFMSLAEHLADRNHTVTCITGYEFSTKKPNIRMVFIPDIQIYNKMPNLFESDSRTAVSFLLELLKTACVKALSYEEVQSLREEKFDLILVQAVGSECFLSFVHELKVPFIFVNPNKAVGMYAPLSGTPAFPSLTTGFFIDLEYPLTFTGRMISTLDNIQFTAYYDWSIVSSQDAECRARQLCAKDMPSLLQLRLNSSLFITNSVKTMEIPTLPYTPTVVHAGGMHCRPAKPLPQDLQQWIAGAGESGFIFFSLGSLVKPSTMDEKYRKVLVEVFGSLHQRVLWKWDENTMEGLPPNVRLSKWLPQQDILGHPQLRLFITHGGLLSLQEATYHSVPVLGMPVAMEQNENMRMVEREGWGRTLYWEDLTNDNFRNRILQVMDDPIVRKEVEKRNRIMHDQPMSPGDWASYWVEYVLRHQGAVHLRSPAGQVPWYELYNVDVWAVLVVVTVLTLGLTSWVFYRVFLALVHCCCGPRKTKKE